MTVASTRTKVEQALSRSFEAVAARLPGGHAAAEARRAAIGTFAALGLPHRRIEQWKWTDLRSALKEALPPAVGVLLGPVRAADAVIVARAFKQRGEGASLTARHVDRNGDSVGTSHK